MVDGIHGPGINHNLLNQLGSMLGRENAQTLVTLLNQGASLEQAFATIFGSEGRGSGQVDQQGLARMVDNLPHDVQQRIAQGADTLPPPVREALDQLGITQPHNRQGGEPVGQGAYARADAAGRADGAPSQAAVSGHAQSQAALAGVESAAAPQASQLANPQQAVAPTQNTDRALPDAQTLAQPASGRSPEATVAARAQEPGQAVVMSDRSSAAQQNPAQPPSTTQALAAAQGRADAVPAQALPAAVAGATQMANPQATAVPAGHVSAQGSNPTGSDAAGRVRDGAHLAPAGHTIAGFLRRDPRPDPNARRQRPAREESLLAAILAGRRREAEDQEESVRSQWLFWILTIVAYGAVAIVVIALLPGGGGLGNGYGRPSGAGYALVVGAAAAIASWFVGRRLARR